MTILSGSVGLLNRFASASRPLLFRNVGLPIEAVGRGAGHHDFQRPLRVVIKVPLGTECDERVVEFDTDAAAHADNHRLAVHRFKPSLEMLHEVFRNYRKALLGPHERFERGPFRLQLLLPLNLLAFCRFLELRIESGTQLLVQLESRQSAFVVDGNGGAVFDSALNVVDRDVVAEN